MYRLMAGFVAYHEALLSGADTEEIWAEIQLLYRKMTGYTFTITYSNPDPELVTRDAMERAGLKALYYRCLKARASL